MELTQLSQFNEELLYLADSADSAQITGEFFDLGDPVVIFHVEVSTSHLHHPFVHCQGAHPFGAIGPISAR